MVVCETSRCRRARSSPWTCFLEAVGLGRRTVRGRGHAGSAEPAERKDAEGEWHQSFATSLPVRLHYLHAEDDRDLVWEPGKEHEKSCSDDECECHTAPLVGRHRD
jgi:hypothetical protein